MAGNEFKFNVPGLPNQGTPAASNLYGNPSSLTNNMAYGPSSNLTQPFNLGTMNPGAQNGLTGGGWKDWFSKEAILGSVGPDGTTSGWLAPAVDLFSGMGSLWMGMKQYGMMKDSIKEDKRRWEKEYSANARLTNYALADRARSRINSSTPDSGYMSVEDTLKNYGVA
jgi:hypothetical protein